MKVLLLNGSSRPQGCTYTALRVIADSLEATGIESEILFLGNEPVRDCTACGTCGKLSCDSGKKVVQCPWCGTRGRIMTIEKEIEFGVGDM